MANLNESLNEIWPVLKKMLKEISAALPAPVGRSVITPGLQPAWDDCCNGQLAIRIAGIQVTNQSPKPAGCTHGGYTYTIGVSVIRCAAVLDDNGKPPTPKAIIADGYVMTADMVAVQHYLECSDKVFRMLTWTPQGPSGGCHGGEWTFTIFQPPLGCCDPETPQEP